MLLTTLFLSGLLAISTGRLINYEDINARIVNGTDAKIGEIPYQVSLQYQSGSHFCGGSILNENYVITAAHCLYRILAISVNVVVGTIDYKKPLSTHKAEELIPHENFNYIDSNYDIALIKVKTPFQFSNLVSPIPLTNRNDTILPNSIAYVSGWGNLGGPSAIRPKVLQKAQIYVADQEYCRTIMQEAKKKIYPGNICANDPNTRRGQCNGDSGGPLTVNGKLAGVVSWSIKDPYCASTKYPGVYTRVSEYIDWINDNAV